MADETQPPLQMNLLDRWVGWLIILALLGMVALWGGFVLAHVPHQVSLPSWVVTILIALGLALLIISTGGLFVAYRYLRHLVRRQQRR